MPAHAGIQYPPSYRWDSCRAIEAPGLPRLGWAMPAWDSNVADQALASFLPIWRLRSSARFDSSASCALIRNASRPPRWSTLLSALADIRNRTERPSASEIIVTFTRLGRNRRLVLMFEWLTLWPVWGPLPVNSHRRDMAYL